MEEKKKLQENVEEVKQETTTQELSPTWAQDCIEDIDDWIESQGIYLRQ